jgi:hypothetical protein
VTSNGQFHKFIILVKTAVVGVLEALVIGSGGRRVMPCYHGGVQFGTKFIPDDYIPESAFQPFTIYHFNCVLM